MSWNGSRTKPWALQCRLVTARRSLQQQIDDLSERVEELAARLPARRRRGSLQADREAVRQLIMDRGEATTAELREFTGLSAQRVRNAVWWLHTHDPNVQRTGEARYAWTTDPAPQGGDGRTAATAASAVPLGTSLPAPPVTRNGVTGPEPAPYVPRPLSRPGWTRDYKRVEIP
jgi:uncharacterized protein YcaQ